MLTYWNFKNLINELEFLFDNKESERFYNFLIHLKKETINYLESLIKVLEDVKNKKVSNETYKLIFQNISEFAMDIDGLYTNWLTNAKNGEEEKSKISKLFKTANLKKETVFFENFKKIMLDILNFLEHNYEDKRISSLNLKSIQNKINSLKSL